jgi:hypothetical protein
MQAADEPLNLALWQPFNLAFRKFHERGAPVLNEVSLYWESALLSRMQAADDQDVKTKQPRMIPRPESRELLCLKFLIHKKKKFCVQYQLHNTGIVQPSAILCFMTTEVP